MRVVILVLFICLVVHSCHRVCHYSSEVIGSVGDIKNSVRERTHGFVVNVRKELDDNEDCTITISPGIEQAGLKEGKLKIGEDSSGNYNRVSVYFSSDKALSRTVTAKIFDADGHEYGRTTSIINAKTGDARFYDFIFPSNTDIEDNSHIVLE